MRVTKLAALALALGNAGCTQAFVEVRHDRPSNTLNAVPSNTLSIGARWFFWDAYADSIADKVAAKMQERDIKKAFDKAKGE